MDRRGGRSRTLFSTPRLTIRPLTADDAPFILALVNDPDWLLHIGDRGIRTLEGAAAYIANGPAATIARHGFGLWLVERTEDGEPLGICGLIRRDTLDDVDLGFAFLPAFRGQGYAFEAAQGTLAHARERHGLRRLLAITTQGNGPSIRLLERLGFVFERCVRLAGEDVELRLFAITL